MQGVTLSTKKSDIRPEEAIDLFLSLGWGKSDDYNLKTMQIALSNTDFIVSAKNEENELVAFIRVFSDDVFSTHITDFVVREDCQGKGIGRRLMNVVVNKYGHTAIYADTFKHEGGSKGFFANLGFVKRTNMETFSRRFT